MKSKNATECKKLLESKEYILIDVRGVGEHEEMRIDFPSMNLPLEEMNSWIKNLDHKKKYILYCRSGSRSSFACKILEENDFEVINLEGGIISWIAEKLEVIND